MKANLKSGSYNSEMFNKMLILYFDFQLITREYYLGNKNYTQGSYDSKQINNFMNATAYPLSYLLNEKVYEYRSKHQLNYMSILKLDQVEYFS